MTRRPMTADDPRHGENRGYVAGCRLDCCRIAHSLDHKARRLHPRPMVDATGTHRRIQALHCLGWSAAAISRHLGKSQFWTQQVLQQEWIYQGTAEAITRLYDELSMTWCTDVWAPRTAATARARGWSPPLAWDDEDLDNPDARPYCDVAPVDVDEVVVERVLAGEWHLPTTKQEKTEASRRFVARGGSLGELERLTGWKSGRYYRLSDETAA